MHQNCAVMESVLWRSCQGQRKYLSVSERG